MLGELISDLLHDLALAAVQDFAQGVEVAVDSDSRVLVFDPESSIVFGAFVQRGFSIRVARNFRVKIEPIESTRLAPLCLVSRTWSTM